MKKANLATDEVRVENQNHGLVRSQSGNNRTVARLLSLFKSYNEGRKYALLSKESHSISHLQQRSHEILRMRTVGYSTRAFVNS